MKTFVVWLSATSSDLASYYPPLHSLHSNNGLCALPGIHKTYSSGSLYLLYGLWIKVFMEGFLRPLTLKISYTFSLILTQVHTQQLLYNHTVLTYFIAFVTIWHSRYLLTVCVSPLERKFHECHSTSPTRVPAKNMHLNIRSVNFVDWVTKLFAMVDYSHYFTYN